MTKQEAIDTEDTTDKLINLFKHCNKVKFILDGVGEEEFETKSYSLKNLSNGEQLLLDFEQLKLDLL